MSTTEITLSSEVTLDELARWDCPISASICFVINKTSGFAHLAEGLALSKLRFLHSKASQLSSRLTYEMGPLDPKNPKLEGIFASLFGIQLVLVSNSIKDSGDRELKVSLGQVCWQAVLTANGLVGDGKKQYFVSRDPIYDCPTIFKKNPAYEFPYPQEFRRVLRSVARQLLGLEEFLATSNDEPIVTFLYETALNSFEHGRIDEHSSIINGVRGFVIEKLQFMKSESIEKRRGFSDPIKQYLKVVWPDLEGSRYQCISLTVTDLGKGIHNTLASLKGESDWQKLNRAFTEEASRKSPAADTRRGLGLPKVLESCQVLKAFLFVASSDLLGYQDFSKVTHLGKDILSPWPTLEGYKNFGTTLTILFPLTQGRIIQPNLFFDEHNSP